MFDVQTINIYRQKITKYLSAIFNFSHIHIFDIKIKICQEERTKKNVYIWLNEKEFLKHGMGCQCAQTGVVQQLYEKLYKEQRIM